MIASDGKLYDSKDLPFGPIRVSIQKLFKVIDSWAIKPTKIYMHQNDWNDIVKWSKEK